MNKHIFREYDIRGVVGKDLTPADVYALGKGIGTKIRGADITRISIGRDVRLSSKEFRDILSDAIRSTGIDVIDIGLVPTPLLYYSLFHLDVGGGVMITASHNPPQFNGFKVCIGKASIYGKEIQDIRDIIEGNAFATGKGGLSQVDIIAPYLAMVKERITLARGLRVVIDGGNGMGGLVAPRLIRELGCQVTELFCEPDGNFPNHFPDPTVEKHLATLIEKVKDVGADVGIAYDGDADRIGVVDERGKIVWGDQLLIIFSREILKRKPGAKIVFEVKSSQTLANDIKRHGGVPIMGVTGHSLIKDRMKKEGAELGGEVSGHMFFADGYYGFDDAIFASCRLLQILSDTDVKLSRMLSDVPETFTTPEIRIDCPDEEKFDIVKRITATFKKDYDVIDIDGARVAFGTGWGLVRASNTQPALVLRFEASTPEELERIKGIVYERLKTCPVLKDIAPF